MKAFAINLYLRLARNIGLTLSGLAIALLLAACGDSGVTTSSVTTTNAATTEATTEVHERVSFEGTDRNLRDRLRFTAQQNNQLADTTGRTAIIAFDFNARDSKGVQVSRFDKPVKISIRYGGLLQNKLAENDLTVVYYNPTSQNWEDVASSLDPAAQVITAEVQHFSRYGISNKSGSTVSGTITNKSGTPVGSGAGGSGSGTITRDGTPVADVKGAGGVVVKYDVTTGLNAFNNAVFGRTYTFTDTGAVVAGVIGSASFPANDKGVLTAKLGAAALAAYGKMSNGLEIVLAGVGVITTNEAAADIAGSALAEVGMWGLTAPTSQSEALALVNQLAPGLSGVTWTLKTTERGGYIFYATGQKAIITSKGVVNTAIGAVATVSPTQDGKALVTVLVGTGASAQLVK